jgi:hypothetical protein
MIGVTAAASAGIYFSRGDIPPLVAAPVALGILVGALVGARLLARISNRLLRLIFLGECQIIVRAWDAAGKTQPGDARSLWNFNGYANNAWHQVQVYLV